MLSPTPTPAWLTALTGETMAHDPLPLRDILACSLFYPAAGIDANPIALLSQYLPSFVHVDYSRTEDDIHAQLLDRRCFRGYDLVGWRRVLPAELLPAGWKSRSSFIGPTLRPLPEEAWLEPAFARWAVYARRPDYGPAHGAARFSLLHIGAEGVLAYGALYHGHGVQAQVLAVVQPSEGFGDNWTRFTAPGWALHQAVCQHPLGPPRYLVVGGGGDATAYTQRACWPGYPHRAITRTFRTRYRQDTLTVWARRQNPSLTISPRFSLV